MTWTCFCLKLWNNLNPNEIYPGYIFFFFIYQFQTMVQYYQRFHYFYLLFFFFSSPHTYLSNSTFSTWDVFIIFFSSSFLSFLFLIPSLRCPCFSSKFSSLVFHPQYHLYPLSCLVTCFYLDYQFFYYLSCSPYTSSSPFSSFSCSTPLFLPLFLTYPAFSLPLLVYILPHLSSFPYLCAVLFGSPVLSLTWSWHLHFSSLISLQTRPVRELDRRQYLHLIL